MGNNATTSATIPPPYVYGLPADKFGSWRVNQPEAAMRSIESAYRFDGIVAPTGFGKSAVAETIARYMGRSMYLTVTKALEDQIANDFADRFDVRGKSNYECDVLAGNGLTGWQARADQADAMCGSCQLKEGGCGYYDAMRQAKRRLHDVTNYAKWLSRGPDDFGEFDVLICDEAHDAVEKLSDALRVELKPSVVERFCHQPMPQSQEMSAWITWSGKHLLRLRPQLDDLATRVLRGDHGRTRDLRDLRSLVRAFDGLQGADHTWVEDRPEASEAGLVVFEPIWPKRYGHRLFGDVRRVVLMSATLRPKDLELLGLSAKEVDFAEYPSSFPVAQRLVIPVPTVRMSGTMTDQERLEAVRRIDQIIDGRLDRKGIVDTVSFERARHLVQHSRHAGIMLTNDPQRRYGRTQSEHTADTVEEFRRRPGPCVLVGPSFSTGWDFPGSQAEYGIVMKIPFLNRHASKVVDARCKDDGGYDGFQAMKKIVQFAGRGMRSDRDRFEVLITDDMWSNWFLRANRQHAPGWFMAAVQEPQPIPRAPEKLGW